LSVLHVQNLDIQRGVEWNCPVGKGEFVSIQLFGELYLCKDKLMSERGENGAGLIVHVSPKCNLLHCKEKWVV